MHAPSDGKRRLQSNLLAYMRRGSLDTRRRHTDSPPAAAVGLQRGKQLSWTCGLQSQSIKGMMSSAASTPTRFEMLWFTDDQHWAAWRSKRQQ